MGFPRRELRAAYDRDAETYDERFAELRLSPKVVMEMRSPEAMRKLVEVGMGISFLPYLVVRESLEQGALNTVRVRGVDFSRQIGVGWRRGRYFGPAIQHLLKAIFARFDKTWTGA